MRDVNIFIAGATALAPQRLLLKALISDLNHRLRDEGKDMQYNVSSYETFGNDQERYNHWIREKTDLVIFVLRDKIGDYTEIEYNIAKQQQSATGKPEVVVMLNSYEQITPEIAYINGLMKGDKYYIKYNNDDDLVLKTKNYLEDYVATIQSASDEAACKPAKTTKFRWNIAFLLFAIIVVFAFLAGYIYKSKSPILLIAGGGSAKNFIEKYNDIKLSTYRNSYYVHMPSENAWLLLTEEVISPQTITRYYPICISASAASDKDFLKITTDQHFLRAGSVIAKKLGYDTLCVSVKNDPYILSQLGTACILEGEISIDKLMTLASNSDSVNVFATSVGSGTRAMYEQLFERNGGNLELLPVLQFSEDSDMPTLNINSNPYILLGSKCYTMKEVDKLTTTNGALHLNVYEEQNGRRVYSRKPMYLYFMGYNPDSNNQLTIPKQTLQLLQDLGCDLSTKVKNGKVKRNTTTKIIQDFDELVNW